MDAQFCPDALDAGEEATEPTGSEERIPPANFADFVRENATAAREALREMGKFRAAMAGGAAAGSAVLTAGCPAVRPFVPADPYEDIIPVALSEALRRLVNRTTFGINAREADLANDLGYDDYIEYHLAHTSIDDTALEQQLERFSTLDMTALERFIQFGRGNDLSLREFYAATFMRNAYSTRQLFERMTEFWSNHFNIYIASEAQIFAKPVDDKEVVRTHAFGTFHDILSASAHSPAMLVYLDNASSRKEAPNENYARELLELHTMGPDNYTQEDIREVARCLTGWSVDLREGSRDAGTFRYIPEWHDNGRKVFLGIEIPAGGGKADGDILLDIIANDPQVAPITAAFIARKIAVQFWGYDPPAAYVQSIADTYLSTGGDIKAMIRSALNAEWMAQAPLKLKRPYHLAMSMLRARPSNIYEYQTLFYFLGTMANLPFDWAPPNGYPDSANYWSSFLIARWNFGTWLAVQDRAAPLELSPFLGELTEDQYLDAVNAYLFNGAMSDVDRMAVANFHAVYPWDGYWRKEALGLAFAAPGFQWY